MTPLQESEKHYSKLYVELCHYEITEEDFWQEAINKMKTSSKSTEMARSLFKLSTRFPKQKANTIPRFLNVTILARYTRMSVHNPRVIQVHLYVYPFNDQQTTQHSIFMSYTALDLTKHCSLNSFRTHYAAASERCQRTKELLNSLRFRNFLKIIL